MPKRTTRPTGRSVAEYPDYTEWTFQRWAWEFLRRNATFQRACKGAKDDTIKQQRVASPTTSNAQAEASATVVILRLSTVRRMTTLGRSTIYRLMALKLFPSAVKLAPRAEGLRADRCPALRTEIPANAGSPMASRLLTKRNVLQIKYLSNNPVPP